MAAQGEKSNVVPVMGRATSGSNHIGALLIDAGKITPQDAEVILRHAREKGMRFGDAATELGLVTRGVIDRIVAQQFEYAYLAPGESPVSPEVVAAYAPFSRPVEALRAVRSQLLLRWFGEAPEQKRLAIVSAERGDGRTYLAANLAVVFSQLGERTLLVDADMRHARQHEVFGLANMMGLSTVLSGRAGLEVIQRIPAFVGLSVLPSGPLPPNPQELLGRPIFSKILEEASTQFDVVIFDTASTSTAADIHAVTAEAKGALLVTRLNRTKVASIQSFSESLSAAGVAIVGAVVNTR